MLVVSEVASNIGEERGLARAGGSRGGPWPGSSATPCGDMGPMPLLAMRRGSLCGRHLASRAFLCLLLRHCRPEIQQRRRHAQARHLPHRRFLRRDREAHAALHSVATTHMFHRWTRGCSFSRDSSIGNQNSRNATVTFARFVWPITTCHDTCSLLPAVMEWAPSHLHGRRERNT